MSILRIGSTTVVPVLRVPTGLPRDVTNGVWGQPTTAFSFKLPSSATSLEEGILQNAFKGNQAIFSVDMSSLTEITGTSTMASFCEGATNLREIDLSNVVTIDGQNVMTNAFKGTAITEVDLSSLVTVSTTGALQNTFFDCLNITSIDLSSLTTLGGGVSMTSAFGVSTTPSTPLPLTSVEFTSLSSISGTAPMRNLFAKRYGLQSLSFPAFTSNTFSGQLTTYLDNIINDVDGCTVHFPSNMQSVIGSWSSVQNGFGGTNTVVAFDLPATE